MQFWGGENYSLRVEEANALSRSPLPLPHTKGGLENILWFVVPTAHQLTAMNGCHQDAGHQGQQWTLYLLSEHFWWPGMAIQMQRAISNCKLCIQHEGSHAKAPMWPIFVTAPLECYMLTLPVSRQWWSWNNPKHGEPFRHTEGYGLHFNHAPSKGQWQTHQMLMCLRGKLSMDQKADWPRHLPKLVHAYNSMKLAINGYNPYYWCFGHQLHLPIDFYFNTIRYRKKHQHVDHYISKLCGWLWEALKEAQVQTTWRWKDRSSTMIGKLMPFHWNQVTWSWLKPMPTGEEESRDQWEQEPYEVEHQFAEGIPSYLVWNQWTGCSQVLHLNWLFSSLLQRGILSVWSCELSRPGAPLLP